MSDLSHLAALIRQDAARWIQPEDYGDPHSLSARDIMGMMYRFLPLRAMVWFRVASWLKANGVRGVGSFVQRRLFRVYGLELEVGADIGGGCYIAHPSGCTIRVERLGENATIVAAVTVGANKEYQWPVVGDRVYLGAGCRVLGPIVVGDDVKVGANAVVLTDVADNITMVGVPAKPIAPRSQRLDTAPQERNSTP